MAFSIRPNEDENHSAVDKTEEEIDIAAADEAYSEYMASGKASRPFSELTKELGL